MPSQWGARAKQTSAFRLSEGDPRGRLRRFRDRTSSNERNLPSLRKTEPTMRPRPREKGPPRFHCRESRAEILSYFSDRVFRRTREHRAPKPLHVGRGIELSVPTIQGRRVGEWLGQHRLPYGERDRARNGCHRPLLRRSPTSRRWTEGGLEAASKTGRPWGGGRPCIPGSSNREDTTL